MEAALRKTGAEVIPNAGLEKRVYWRVGGAAEFYVEAHTLTQLQKVMALNPEPLVVLGRGSNVLVHDDGVPGVVLRLAGELASLTLDGVRAVAGGGLSLVALLSRLDRAGLAGAECLSGIPGTVGGAVAMNAGTSMGEISDLVEEVEAVVPGGALVSLPPQALSFRYRGATLPNGAVISSAKLRLSDRDVEARKERRQVFLARRKATQPLSRPSCGSTFTNPPGDYAGRLIEAAGLKGARCGGAEISAVHANFIVNHGDATAEDIRSLIVLARRRVLEESGVLLTPEVRLVGPWSANALVP